MPLDSLAQPWKDLDPLQPKKIAVVMAGGGSLGAYEGGVLIELAHALTSLNQQLDAAHEGRFVIDVLTGASAGGMSAAVFARAMLGSLAADRGSLYEAWVERINIHDLLKPTPEEANALLSKQILRDISGRYLMPIAGQRAPASFLPADSLLLGLTLTNLNGLDYHLPSVVKASIPGAGYNTTRFSDFIAWTLPCTGDLNRLRRGAPPWPRAGGPITDSWSEVQTAAIACGNFPIAFMPQPFKRYAEEYVADNLTQNVGYFDGYPELTFIDGGMFDNEPLGAAINLAATRDPNGRPDSQRLFLLVHPNITLSAHKDGVGSIGAQGHYQFTPYTDPRLGLGAQIGRLIDMLMTENAVSDWVRAHKVNSLLGWRKQFLAELVQIVSQTSVANADVLKERLTRLALEIAKAHEEDLGAPADAYLQAALARVLSDAKVELEPSATSALHEGSVGQEIFQRIVFILDHVSELQEKRPLRLEVIGRNPEGPPLAGQSINGFAGFFEMAWREYDYRRGRSDAYAALQMILGTYDREAPADQPTAGRPPLEARGSKISRPDEYNTDVSLWKVWSRFPEVNFADLSPDDQDALTTRIVDRGKALLGLSGVTGWAFGLVVKGKIASMLSGKEK